MSKDSLFEAADPNVILRERARPLIIPVPVQTLGMSDQFGANPKKSEEQEDRSEDTKTTSKDVHLDNQTDEDRESFCELADGIQQRFVGHVMRYDELLSVLKQALELGLDFLWNLRSVPGNYRQSREDTQKEINLLKQVMALSGDQVTPLCGA